MNTNELLTERGNTHGKFENNAVISQGLKTAFRSLDGWDNLSPVMCEAIDMICLKFSRIMSGKSNELQHWEDIVGYAQLVCDDLERHDKENL